MRRPLWLAALLATATLAAGRGGHAARDQKTTKGAVSRCVSYERRSTGDDGLELRLSNECEFSIACTVSWQLRCGRGKRPEARSSDLELGSGATDSAFASAGACEGDWEISRVHWSCDRH